MKFKDTPAAIMWAEEYASRPDLGSQMKQIIDGGSGGGGEVVWDIAMTISARVAACEPKRTGLALKCIYGGRDQARDYILGEQLARHISMTDHGKKKTMTQLHLLGISVIKAERAQTVYGDRYPLARMARDVGISRKNFTKGIGWVALRSLGTEALRAWADQGEAEMALFLDERALLWD